MASASRSTREDQEVLCPSLRQATELHDFREVSIFLGFSFAEKNGRVGVNWDYQTKFISKRWLYLVALQGSGGNLLGWR